MNLIENKKYIKKVTCHFEACLRAGGSSLFSILDSKF
jgi:hypothetical protein